MMAVFKSFQLWMIYGLIILSFGINLFFVVKKLYSLFFRVDAKKRMMAALALLLIFSSSMFFLSAVTVRGGYDNNHDVEYLSNNFFNAGDMRFLKSKEASPVITDGISDIVSGFSLNSIVIKNRLLMFFTALILLAILIKLKLEYSAVIAGVWLFSFNFLAILNANTFSTTSSNMFFWLSSIFALVCFQREKENIRGNLIWALSAMFLILTSRYELFLVSFMGFLIAVVIYLKNCERRVAVVKKHVLLGVSVLTYFVTYIIWFVHINTLVVYNGPDIKESFKVLEHFKYQLIERNAAFFMSQASVIIPLLVVGALCLIFIRGFKDKERSVKKLIIGIFVVFWMIYFSIIFIPLDSYPLQFMRHRLYFFIPFVILFAFAWDSMMYFLRHVKFLQIFKPIALILLMLIYGLVNIRTVESLQNERRTNDIELDFLSKAQGELGNKYTIIFPAVFDNKFFFLKKYFPFYDDCSLVKNGRYVKYVSTEKFIIKRKGNVIQNYHPLKENYVNKEDKAVVKVSFKHKFYTMWSDLETRDEIPIEIGFYYADNYKDRAWILNSKGYCAFGRGDLNKALEYFQDAVKIDSKCIVCAYNLSAAYALSGREKEALSAIKNNIKSRSSYGAPAFEKALVCMAVNEKKAARDFLERFVNGDREKNKDQNKILVAMASMYSSKLDWRILQGEKRRMQNEKKWNDMHKKISDVPYIKESKLIADMAVKKYMEGDIKGARKDFKRAIKINPGNIEAQVSMCSINLLEKDFDEALKYCDSAVNMAEFPDKNFRALPGILADTLFLRAEIYGNMKEYQKASLDLKKALKTAPADWKDFKKTGEKLKKFEKLKLFKSDT